MGTAKEAFVNGSTLKVCVFEYNEEVQKFLDGANYTHTTMGGKRKLKLRRMYYGVTHRPEKLEEMMSKDSAAFKLWTNSLVVMALEDARRGFMNNIKDLFGDVKTDLGMLGLLSEKQLDIFRSEVEAAMERAPLSREQEMELIKDLSQSQQKSMLTLLTDLEDTEHNYSSPTWTGRTAEQKGKLSPGKHNLELQEFNSIFKNATANAEPNQRAKLIKVLESGSFPKDEKTWRALSTDGYQEVEVEEDKGGEAFNENQEEEEAFNENQEEKSGLENPEERMEGGDDENELEYMEERNDDGRGGFNSDAGASNGTPEPRRSTRPSKRKIERVSNSDSESESDPDFDSKRRSAKKGKKKN